MTLLDQITDDLAKKTEHPQTTEVMTRLFLVDSKYRLDAVFADLDWAHPELKNLQSQVSTLAGICAYLLDQLHQLDGGTATDVAWQVHDWCDDGEGCADWVTEEIQRRGIGHLVPPPTPAVVPAGQHETEEQ